MAIGAEDDCDRERNYTGVNPSRIPFYSRHSTLLSIGVMLILLAVFYYPVWFGGQTFLAPDAVNIRCAVPFVQDALERGVYPLWNPYICGGMPSFASMYMVPNSDWLGLGLKAVNWLVSPLGEPSYFMRLGLNYLLFGVSLFIFLRDRRLTAGACLLASVGLIFAPPVVAFSVFSHTGKLLTAALIPAIFMLAHRLLDRRRMLDFCLLGIFVGFQLLRSHVQICYYTLLMIGLYWVTWSIVAVQAGQRWSSVTKATGMLAGSLLAGLAMSSFLSLSVWEYSHYSIRGQSGSGPGFQFATNWSLHPAEIVNFVIPSFMGFGGSTYWGSMPFTDFPVYLGLVTMVIAGLAVVIRREMTTWFFAGLFVFSLMVSFGKHFPIFYRPMFEYLPLFNRFRVPSMISILMVFSLAVLAGFGLDSLMKIAGNPNRKVVAAVKIYLLAAGAIVAVSCSILILGKPIYLGWAARVGSEALAAYEMALSDGFRAVLLFAATAVLIMVTLKGRRWSVLMPFALIVLVLIDVWPVNNRYMKRQIRPDTSVEQIFRESPDVTFLKDQERPFRIMTVNDSRSPNWYMHHFIESVGGYHAAKLRIYQTFIDRFTVAGAIPKNYVRQTAQGMAIRNPATLSPSELNSQSAFFKLMNIRYLVSPMPLHQLDTTLREVVAPQAEGQNAVFAFQGGLPRIWFPGNVITVSDEAAALDHVAGGDFDPQSTAIVEELIEGPIGDVSLNSATIESIDIQRMVVKADVKQSGLLVFSEVYYPAGWRATVDGEPTKIYKTDFLLRSIWLDPGQHVVEMVFDPPAFRLGLTVSLVMMVLLTAGAVASWWAGRRTVSV